MTVAGDGDRARPLEFSDGVAGSAAQIEHHVTGHAPPERPDGASRQLSLEPIVAAMAHEPPYQLEAADAGWPGHD